MLWFTDLAPEGLLGQPELAGDVDLRLATVEPITSAGRLRIDRDGTLHGLACWFDSLLCPGITIDNTPPRTESSWSHGFLPLAQELVVSAGDELAWEVSVSADGEHWTWSVERVDG